MQYMSILSPEATSIGFVAPWQMKTFRSLTNQCVVCGQIWHKGSRQKQNVSKMGFYGILNPPNSCHYHCQYLPGYVLYYCTVPLGCLSGCLLTRNPETSPGFLEHHSGCNTPRIPDPNDPTLTCTNKPQHDENRTAHAPTTLALHHCARPYRGPDMLFWKKDDSCSDRMHGNMVR